MSRGFFLVFLLFLSPMAGAANFFQEGEKELQKDNPKGALVYLEAALEQEKPTEKLYLYLALAYERLDMRPEARKMLKKGIEIAGPLQYLLFYNAGSLALKDKDYPGAEEAFQKSLDLRPKFSDARLNRANGRLESKNYPGAIEDYKAYLDIEPNSPQRPQIEALLAKLEKAILAQEEEKKRQEAEKLAQAAREKRLEEERKAEEERKRLEAERLAKEKAEQDRLAAEQKRLAEEKARQEAERLAAEEKRRQAELLAKIQNSLNGAGQNGESLTTGPAGAEHTNEGFNLTD